MNLTNKFGLPEPLVRAVAHSDYDKEGCDYSVSELLRPACMVALEKRHADELTEDASDRLWLLLGSAGHAVLQRTADTAGRILGLCAIAEERAIVEIEVDGKTYKVGGKFDYGVFDSVLYDYKFTSVWSAKDGPRSDWVAQLNIYRFLAHRYGVAFDKLQIVAILRDWSKPKAAREPDYPQSQVKVMDLPLWRDDTTEQFIIDRIRAHEAAKVNLPECSPEEMWEKPEVWAVKRPDSKRALRLYSTKEEAERHAHMSAVRLTVEHRPAERTRCESYCRVGACGFCEQWKNFQKGVDAAPSKAV